MKVVVIVVVINHCGPGNDVVCPGNNVVHGPGNNVGMGADNTGCLTGNHHIVVHSTFVLCNTGKGRKNVVITDMGSCIVIMDEDCDNQTRSS